MLWTWRLNLLLPPTCSLPGCSRSCAQPCAPSCARQLLPPALLRSCSRRTFPAAQLPWFLLLSLSKIKCQGLGVCLHTWFCEWARRKEPSKGGKERLPVSWMLQGIVPHLSPFRGTPPLQAALPITKLTGVSALARLRDRDTPTRQCPGCATREVARVLGTRCPGWPQGGSGHPCPEDCPAGLGASGAALRALRDPESQRGRGAVLGGRGAAGTGTGAVTLVAEGLCPHESPWAQGHSPWVGDCGPCG